MLFFLCQQINNKIKTQYSFNRCFWLQLESNQWNGWCACRRLVWSAHRTGYPRRLCRSRPIFRRPFATSKVLRNRPIYNNSHHNTKKKKRKEKQRNKNCITERRLRDLWSIRIDKCSPWYIFTHCFFFVVPRHPQDLTATKHQKEDIKMINASSNSRNSSSSSSSSVHVHVGRISNDKFWTRKGCGVSVNGTSYYCTLLSLFQRWDRERERDCHRSCDRDRIIYYLDIHINL